MTILCGTDFTPPALEAERAARALAVRWEEDLILAHVVEEPDSAIPLERVEERARRVGELLEQARQRLGPRVKARTELLSGFPDRELEACASRAGAGLVVVGALGRRSPREWALGSTADRIARTSRVPVLVVRGGGPFEAWERGERPLRVLLGLDLSATSDAAVEWTAELRARGPCTVLAAHVYWPPELREKLHLAGIPIGPDHPDVERALEGELRSRLASLAGDVEPRMLGGLGRVADHLVQLASEERADLVVVGTRQRTGLQRLWHGSVSHGVLDLSPTSVACVPAR